MFSSSPCSCLPACLLLPLAGKYWCWVHWTYQTSTYAFTRCKEVLLRAWDSRCAAAPGPAGVQGASADAQARPLCCKAWSARRALRSLLAPRPLPTRAVPSLPAPPSPSPTHPPTTHRSPCRPPRRPPPAPRLRPPPPSQNGQPAYITWNVMGMMNNCYYRIKVLHQVDAQGRLGLRFQHPAPVPPGELGNVGWREEDNLAKQVGRGDQGGPVDCRLAGCGQAWRRLGRRCADMSSVPRPTAAPAPLFSPAGRGGGGRAAAGKGGGARGRAAAHHDGRGGAARERGQRLVCARGQGAGQAPGLRGGGGEGCCGERGEEVAARLAVWPPGGGRGERGTGGATEGGREGGRRGPNAPLCPAGAGAGGRRPFWRRLCAAQPTSPRPPRPPKVYDATPFLADHPGGAESILISAGMDATDEFNSIHSSKAKGMLADYLIGELDAGQVCLELLLCVSSFEGAGDQP